MQEHLIQLRCNCSGEKLYPKTLTENVYTREGVRLDNLLQLTIQTVTDALGNLETRINGNLSSQEARLHTEISDLNASLTGEINSLGTSVEETAEALSLKADASLLDTLSQQVINNNTAINLRADEIESSVGSIRYLVSADALDLSTFAESISGYIIVTYSAEEPATPDDGDIWVKDSNFANLYRYEYGEFDTYVSMTVSSLLTVLHGETERRRGSLKIYATSSQPEGMQLLDAGDAWIDTSHNNALYKWSGSEWKAVKGDTIEEIYEVFESLTNLSTSIYYKESAPTDGLIAGDTWYDTSTGNVYQWSAESQSWVENTDTIIKSVLRSVGDAYVLADGKIMTYSQAEAPVSSSSRTLGIGDLWVDTNDSNKLYRWSGTEWVSVDAVEALTLGGRNLWFKTKEYDASSDTIWFDNTSGTGVLTAPHEYTTDGFGVQRIASAATDVSQRVRLEANTVYCLSAWIKSETESLATIGAYVDESKATVLSRNFVQDATIINSYGRYWFTFRTKTEVALSTCRFESVNNNPYLIYGLQLEKGSKVTDWTPAPEDVSSALTSLSDLANSKTTVYYSDEVPTSSSEGDIWYDLDDEKIKRRVGDNWVDITNNALKSALTAASEAKAAADGKIRTFAQSTAPEGMAEGDLGDLWIDTDDHNKLYRWNGTDWASLRDDHIDATVATLQSAIQEVTDEHIISTVTESAAYTSDRQELTALINTKVRSYAQDDEPTSTESSPLHIGDLWIDTSDENKLYRWTGDAWVSARDGSVAIAEQTADRMSWLIASGASASDMVLTSDFYNVVSPNIDLSANTSFTLKVGTDEVIQKINASSEGISIDATKLQISDGSTNNFTFGQAHSSIPYALYCGGQRGTATSTGISASNADWAFWAGDGKFRVTRSGALYATAASLTGTFSSANGRFVVDSNGNLTATSATLSGSFTAGGWGFTGDGLSYDNGMGDVSSKAKISFDDATYPTVTYFTTENMHAVYGADPYCNTSIVGAKVRFSVTENLYKCEILNYSGYSHLSFVPEYDSTGNLGCGPITSQGVPSRMWDYAAIRYIYCPGGVHTSSSRLIKHDIKELDDVGDIIDKLDPVHFVLNSDKENKVRAGLIYEDTKPILPEICYEKVEGDMSTAGIDYASLSPILLKEIQSLRKRIALLENK